MATPEPAACPMSNPGRAFHVMPKPCEATATSGRCPFRLDADPGEFSAERYEMLADTAGGPGREVPLGGKVFACHHTQDGAPVACAGWMAVVGQFHLGVRFALASGLLDASRVGPKPGWPALHESYDSMAAVQAGGKRAYNPDRAQLYREIRGEHLRDHRP